MDDAKTEITLIGSKHLLGKINLKCIQINEVDIDISKCVKYLGVKLHQSLTMTKYIGDKCRIASYNLHNIKMLKKHLSQESLLKLVNAMVTSLSDYGNAMLAGLPDSVLKPLRKNSKNSAARVISGLCKYYHLLLLNYTGCQLDNGSTSMF